MSNTKMSRRALLAATASGVAARGATLPSNRKPNVLWICTDQQRWDTIHSLGNRDIRTPNLDKLVASSVAFTRAHCQAPICTPSRASFLTGMYPSSVHACMNGNASWANAAPLVTRLLADAGYYCGLAGKLHLSAAERRIEKRPDDGYQEFYWNHDPSGAWPEGDAYAEWIKSRGEDLNGLRKRYGYIPAELHQTTWCANKAIEFMRERRSPWLMSVNIFDPHPPFDPPKEYLDRFDLRSLAGPLFRDSDLEAQKKLQKVHFQSEARNPREFDGRLTRAKYLAQIELIDENVGRMLQCLDETGQREDTVVVFTSDHGETAGDHGLLYKGCRFYEGLVRVPLIVSWPGHFRKGLQSDALVELTDIAPTLLELANLPRRDAMQGRSLVPILAGTSPAAKHRDFVRCEYYRALGTTMLRKHLNESFGTMIRTEDYKLVVYHGYGLGELFDLQNDPAEFQNLWNDKRFAEVRFDLLTKSFDALAFAVDLGPQRVGRF